ncbi:hypothetical protein SEVIR_5G350700v4 [Setaria viridis]|uniref:Uncharacterized protein n=1 Tax=Setaria viridis TaxID=4556 RepID=A0A4U6ULD6_SETVI|nr:protein odd-skipped [Setaria viridis]TKW17201.1 hypothetical protein SEVIR_5G350700v2 [Setaria viridis]
MGNCTASQRAVESWADDGEWEEEASSSEEGDHHHHHHDHHHHERPEEHASEVTIRITKRQLHELMEKRASGGHGLQLPVLGLGSRRSTEQLLADIMNSGEVHHHREEHWHWKPALQSIPEAVES